jgi:hypothetical protein
MDNEQKAKEYLDKQFITPRGNRAWLCGDLDSLVALLTALEREVRLDEVKWCFDESGFPQHTSAEHREHLAALSAKGGNGGPKLESHERQTVAKREKGSQ